MATKTITAEVADNVAAAITRSGKTKTTVANAVGIPPTTFNRKISGHADFTMSELDRIANILDANPADLLPETMRAAA